MSTSCWSLSWYFILKFFYFILIKLGLDIHDSPTISKNIDIMPGVVLTIEPGNFFFLKQNLLKFYFLN